MTNLKMSINVPNNIAGSNNIQEIYVYLVECEHPVRLKIYPDLNAEYVTRIIAISHLKVGPVVLEVRNSAIL